MNFTDCYRIAEEFFPKTRRKTLRKRIRFALRTYLFYRPTIEKMASFFAVNELRSFIIGLPGMKEHIYRPQVRKCFYRNSSSEHRLYFLCSHFEQLEKNHSEESIKAIYTNSLPPIEIQEGDISLSVKIGYAHDMSREGLLLLSLEMNNIPLYKIAFWLMNYEGTSTLCIGALQGGKDTLEANRLFTKELFGLRPQNMALTALRCYAQAIGIAQFFTFPQAKLWSVKISEQTGIDELWQEQGATPVGTTPFIKLALNNPRKDLSEIATRKRSMYRKRYEFLDKLEPQLVTGFEQHTNIKPAQIIALPVVDRMEAQLHKQAPQLQVG